MREWGEVLKSFLKGIGLYGFSCSAWRTISLLRDRDLRRRDRQDRAEFSVFKKHYGKLFLLERKPTKSDKPVALIVSNGSSKVAPIELALIQAFRLAGFRPIVVSNRNPWTLKYYRMGNVDQVVFWDEFTIPFDFRVSSEVIDRIHSIEDLLTYQFEGARVGRFSASTSLRFLRVGRLDLAQPEVRQQLIQSLALARSYSVAAREIVEKIRPKIALFMDRGYSPQGELFDQCVNAGVEAITWNVAHKNNTVVFKRYRKSNMDEHPSSLSQESWSLIREMSWTKNHEEQLINELRNAYLEGEWYSEVGTQVNKRLLSREDVIRLLKLDPSKKTAVIFSHILWDATFFWGKDLFQNYEEWLVESVRAACANPGVNWVIKVHPANLVKNVRDGVVGEAGESRAIKEQIGKLPSHVFLIPAESEINTFSLFDVMDYCLTVRGTIGIEAASFGIPVLTAGTGRYDQRGFTVDSESPEEYLSKLKSIQQIPKLSPEQKNLAQRFAYGIFILRPLILEAMTVAYEKDAQATLKTEIHIDSTNDWSRASDLKALAEWLNKSDKLDFLMSCG